MAVSYTSAGEGFVVDKIDGTNTSTAFVIAWGTGGSGTGSTATKTDTALQAEATEARATTVTSQPAADKNQWLGTLTAGTAKTIEEMMLTVSATGGICIIRATHGAVALGTGDSIQYTVTLEQS